MVTWQAAAAEELLDTADCFDSLADELVAVKINGLAAQAGVERVAAKMRGRAALIRQLVRFPPTSKPSPSS